ncbi:MAG: ferritin-like domain-containing protein, partial [Lentisphaerales bacterium]|nr:ferritin-like domain-containing protein [Lentisphaerales bacterium]
MNKFFWDALAQSDTLQKFIAGMSLTFEQANLDFSLYYKDAFETIGDSSTAEVLQIVYDDEITHVCHGLSWFRRWKKKGVSDWEEYAKILEIPLSPSRGKGPLFDLEGRHQAGFDDEFINQMKVTSMSRGRSPDVYIFHGFTEVSINEGASFNFPGWGRQLEKEMSVLPLVFCRQDDLLLSWGKISVQHLQKLQDCGMNMPEVAQCSFDKEVPALHKRHAGSIRPWGWSPYIHDKLLALIKQNSKITGWQPEYKELFSKSFAVSVAKELKEAKVHPWFSECDIEPDLCQSLEAVKKSVDSLYKTGWKSVVVKAPLGTSGRNMLRVFEGEIKETQVSQIMTMLTASGEVIVEPWAERALDFSLHFDVNEQVKFKGVTRLLNDERGQYSGSLFGNPWREVDKDCLKLLQSSSKRGINGFGDVLAGLLTKELSGINYRGPLGIDCFIYKNRAGELKVRPIVEMNFRYTMGRVALVFEKYLKPGRTGRLSILSLKSKRQKHLRSRVKELSQSIPERNEQGMWERGVLLLNEYSDQLNFPILVAVGNNGKDCEELIMANYGFYR